MASEALHLLGLQDKQWIWLATVVFASTFFLGAYSALKLRRKAASSYILGLVCFGWAMQTIGLYARGLQYGGCPLANRFELVQFMVWSAIVLYIFVGSAFRISLLGVFTSGFACLFSILSLTFPSWDSASRSPIFGNSPWIEVHAALALFSYGVFGVLALTSSMYLLQSRSLKSKKVVGGLFPFLPSIVELVNINRRLLAIGLVILTCSIAIGQVYFARDSYSVIPLKLIMTGVVWAAYALLFVLRLKLVLSSKQFSWACIAVFVAALLSLDAVNRSVDKAADTRVEESTHRAATDL